MQHFLVLSVLILICPVSLAQGVYHVTPTEDAACTGIDGGDYCLTLSQYEEQSEHYFATGMDVTMLFLPGTHQLCGTLNLTDIQSISLVGSSPGKTFIQCMPLCGGGIQVEFVSHVWITNLSFQSCGIADETGYLPALLLFAVYDATLSDVGFHSNKLSGAVWVFYSNVRFEGTVSFVENEDYEAGALYGENSFITFMGTQLFEKNSAVIVEGGAVLLTTCQAWFYGTTTFRNNFARASGGAMFIENTESVIFNGTVLFEGNRAMVVGGAVMMQNTSLAEFAGNITFISNQVGIDFKHSDSFSSSEPKTETSKRSVQSTSYEWVCCEVDYGGGALYAEIAHVSFIGSVLFQNNSAIDDGGAVALISGSMTISDKVYFNSNQATKNGGAIMALNASVGFEGDVRFSENHAGAIGGAICSIIDTDVVFSVSSSFVSNSARKHGGAIFASARNTLNFMGYTAFDNNTCVNPSEETAGGALAVWRSILTFNQNASFHNNFANAQGGAMYLDYTDVTFLKEAHFYANGIMPLARVHSGGAVHASTSQLIFNGATAITENQADFGGAMRVANTMVLFNKNTTFYGNSASKTGGGLFFAIQNRTRLLYIGADAVVQFVSNSAERGGAIAVTDFLTSLCYAAEFAWEATSCFFQPIDFDYRDLRVQLTIINNTASISGSAVYGGMFDRCGFTDTARPFAPRNFDGVYYFLRLSHIENPDMTLGIASDPYEVRLCSNGTLTRLSQISVSVRRGQIFNLSIAAVGEADVIVPVALRANFPTQTGEEAQLAEREAIQAAGSTCSSVHYSVRSPRNSEILTIYSEGPCRDISGVLTVQINFLPCPDGFELSFSECICESSLQSYTNTCNVNDESIFRRGNFWIGAVYDDNRTYRGLIIHPNCPFDYCQSEPISVKLQNTDTQCALERSGLLCGECRPGLSLALGSSRCLKCSNFFISLVFVFALAGILLVCMLLILNLTVSAGTINGLVFYANIVAVNKAIFFPPNDSSILSVFIAWLNLDFGFEVCFFHGLDTYGKMWLQFVFPAYVWTLVALTIVGSYYSTLLGRLLGRNPVAVLATLFLLSYAKILRTIIAILSFTYLDYPDGIRTAVWLHDGNILISDPKYIVLLVTAILTLLFIFLPYTLVLLFSQWIQVHSEMRVFRWINNPKLKAFLDAYHAPYKNKYRYWTGMLLILRCGLYIVFSLNTLGDPSVNLLSIATAVLGLAILMRFTGLVYNRKYIDILDASCFLNLGVLAAATYHIRAAGGSQTAAAYASTAIALIAFVGVVIFHCYLQLKDKAMVQAVMTIIIFWKGKNNDESSHATGTEREFTQEAAKDIDARAGVPVTFVELREPLELLTN